jgi:hypothetical protein
MEKTEQDWVEIIKRRRAERTGGTITDTVAPEPPTGTFNDPLKKRREYWKDTRNLDDSSKPSYDEWHRFHYPLLLDPSSRVAPNIDKGLIKSRSELAEPGNLTPASMEEPALVTQGGGSLTPQEKRAAEERYGADGRPIDVMTGADTSDRFWTSFMRDTKDRIQFYRNKYGEDSVRVVQNELGTDVLVLRKPDGTDLLIDEEQMSDKDLADVAGFIPEIAGAIAGFGVAGKVVTKAAMKPFIKWVIQSAATAGSGQLAGAMQDVAARASVGNEIQPAEIATERARRFGEDMVFNALLAGGARASRTAINLGLNPSRALSETYKGLSEQAIKSRDKIYELSRTVGGKNAIKEGLDVPLDPATLTGNEFVSRAYSMALNLPFTGPVRQLSSKQKEALMRAHKVLTGDIDDITTEQIGREIVPVLENQVNDVGEVAEVLRSKVVKSGIENLKTIFNNAQPSNPFVRESYKRDVGQSIIDEAKVIREKFKDESSKLYQLAQKSADDAGAVFDITAYQKKVGDLFGDLLKDTEGEPALEVLSPMVAKFMTKAGNYPNKVTFSEIQSLRTAIDREIAENVAMRKPDDKRLIELSDVLRQSIEDAGGNKQAQQALKAANLYYKKNNDKFRTDLFSKMFKPVEKGGIGGERLVDSLVGKSSENYLELKKLLGPEKFGLVRATALDGIMNRFKDGDTINATQFLKFLKDPNLFNKEVRDDLLGDNSSKLMRELSLLEKVQDPRVSVDALEALVKSGNVSRARIEKLISARKVQDKQYANKFLKPFLDGKTNDFDPQDFVEHFLTKGNLTDVKNTVSRLKSGNPEVYESLRRKVVFRYFQLAARTLDPEDATKQGMLIDSAKMKELLDGNMGIKDARAKLKAILTKDEFDFFDNATKLQQSFDVTQSARAAKTAGGLATGAIVHEAFKMQPLKLAHRGIKLWASAFMMTRPRMLKWMQTEARVGDADYLSRVLATSTPFINGVLQQGNYEAGTERVFGSMYKAATLIQNELESGVPESSTQMRPSADRRTY